MDTNGRIMSTEQVRALPEAEKRETFLIPRKYRIKVACMNRVDRRKWLKRNRHLLIRADQVPDGIQDACGDCFGTGLAGVSFITRRQPVCTTCKGTGKEPKVDALVAAAEVSGVQIPMIPREPEENPHTKYPRPEPAQEPYP